MLLRDVEELPAEEVAEQMNCSKATVRSHIANARIKMRRYMERSRRTAPGGSRHEAPRPKYKSRCLPAGIWDAGTAGAWRGTWRIAPNASTKCRLCESRQQLRELSGEMPELPNDLNWNRLAEEMTGNIRVGLAAGEAIALFDKPRRARPRLGWNAALVVLGATAGFRDRVSGPVFRRQQAEHLMAALKRIRTERIGTVIQLRV